MTFEELPEDMRDLTEMGLAVFNGVLANTQNNHGSDRVVAATLASSILQSFMLAKMMEVVSNK